MGIEEYQKDVPDALTRNIEASRKRLYAESPRIYKKVMNYLEAEKDPDNRQMSLIGFAYGFECNFSCTHCSADILQKQHNQRMSMEQVKYIADQADELGVFAFCLIGGEPLVWPELADVVKAIGPSRFYISLSTNGWLLTNEMAKHLANIGVKKVTVSILSGTPSEHDKFCNKSGSFLQAVAAVENGLLAGLNTLVSTVVTHQNLHSAGFHWLLRLVEDLDVCLDLQVATPNGKWLGNLDALIDAEDAEYIRNLRTRYPLLRRDIFPTPGARGGCPAVTGSLYIIPSGEVLPCLFIHISLGDVLEAPLAAIRQRGLGIKELREFSSVCLAGEQCPFFSKYMTKTFQAKSFPLSYEEGFGEKTN